MQIAMRQMQDGLTITIQLFVINLYLTLSSLNLRKYGNVWISIIS